MSFFLSLCLPAFLLVIFIACVASLYTEGMWGNAIRLINVVTAALLATNFWEPTARWLESQGPSFTYAWDFLALWGLFGVFMVVFRLATDFLSRVKVRFLNVADRIGSVFLAVLVGWVMVCFTTMTLHTAPLARNSWAGEFQPEKKLFRGLAPDRVWLGFMQKLSYGAFCHLGTELESNEETVFDPRGEFLPKYATRRANLEAHMAKSTTKSIRVTTP
jgi:uncharacterized membrane protein required for colicin V production